LRTGAGEKKGKGRPPEKGLLLAANATECGGPRPRREKGLKRKYSGHIPPVDRQGGTRVGNFQEKKKGRRDPSLRSGVPGKEKRKPLAGSSHARHGVESSVIGRAHCSGVVGRGGGEEAFLPSSEEGA